MSSKVTNKDAMNAVKAFTEQGESYIAFGTLADIKQREASAFIKGEESDILALLAMQMAKDNDFKRLLFKAVEIYKVVPIEKFIAEYENKHSRDN